MWTGFTEFRIESLLDMCEHDNLTFVSRKGGKISVRTEWVCTFRGLMHHMESFHGLSYTRRLVTSNVQWLWQVNWKLPRLLGGLIHLTDERPLRTAIKLWWWSVHYPGPNSNPQHPEYEESTRLLHSMGFYSDKREWTWVVTTPRLRRQTSEVVLELKSLAYA